jgi:hypothetical protein
MAKSVLDAIKSGFWDFEPKSAGSSQYPSTQAMPGTDEKVDVLAERVRQGLPLWHPSDRLSFDENEQPRKKPR